MQIKGFFTIFFLSFVLGGGLLAMEQQPDPNKEELLNLVNSYPNGEELLKRFKDLSDEVSKAALLATLLDEYDKIRDFLLKDEEMGEFYEKLRLGNLEDTDASARVKFVNSLFDAYPGLRIKYSLHCFEIYEFGKPTKDTSSK